MDSIIGSQDLFLNPHLNETFGELEENNIRISCRTFVGIQGL